RVGSNGTRRSPPRRQIVGQFDLYGRTTIGTGSYIRLPEGRVLELSANGRFNVFTFVLKVGKLISGLVLRKIHRLIARVTGERIGDRQVSFDGVVAHAIELVADAAGKVLGHAVNCFVNHSQTNFRAWYWNAIGAASQNGVRGCLARLVLLLIRDDFEV